MTFTTCTNVELFVRLIEMWTFIHRVEIKLLSFRFACKNELCAFWEFRLRSEK